MKNLFCLLLLFFVFAFKTDEHAHVSIKESSDFFAVDKLGNVYLVKGDQLKKYTSKGELLKVFSNKRFGEITSIDVSNPLRVLVFYKDFAQVIILDSQLSQNGDAFSLESIAMEQCDLACSSFNNGMWFYNRQNAELVRLNENFKISLNTGNLNIMLNLILRPVFMTENSGYLYLQDEKEGILVFDIYGTYYKTIPLKGFKGFKVNEDKLVYRKDSLFSSYDLKLLSSKDTLIKDSLAKDIKLENNTWFYRYADSVTIYR